MIDFVWAVLCSGSLIDSATNNISLINVIEQVMLSPDTPIPINIPISMEMVTLWSRSDLEVPVIGRQRITVIGPNGKELIVHEQEIDLQIHIRVRMRAGFQGFPIEELGVHTFQIERIEEDEEGVIVARIPLVIVKAEEED